MTAPDTVQYFNALADDWSDRYARSPHFRSRLATVLDWVRGEPPGSSLLDYGCGSGVMVRSLVERGFVLTGVDVSSGMIAAARTHLVGAGADRYRLELIDADGLGGTYAQATYQGVLCIAVLEYVQNSMPLLTRFAGLVAPGGFMILSLPNRRSLLRRLERTLQRPPLRTVAAWAGLSPADGYLRFQARQFTLPGLDGPLAALGFSRERACRQIAPFPLRAFENHDRIGMNLMVKYRKRHEPREPLR